MFKEKKFYSHSSRIYSYEGVLIGKGHSPDKAYETMEEWEWTGKI